MPQSAATGEDVAAAVITPVIARPIPAARATIRRNRSEKSGLASAANRGSPFVPNAAPISTQSSLASLPAMLAATRRLGVRESTSDFVLPLAVAIFRGTSPAMNLGVAIYAAYLTGTPLSVPALAAGVVVAFLVSLSSVSLPGTLSFIISVGPIAMAMGVPVAPLGLLVAVEMLPDLMRTLGNVTMDVAVTAAVDEGHD